MPQCLCCNDCLTPLHECRHTDFVTALDFHPIDDKYFVSGSIDGKVLFNWSNILDTLQASTTFDQQQLYVKELTD